MDTKQILASIEYKPGVVLIYSDETDEPFELGSQVFKVDRGRLMVKVDEGVELLARDLDVELEVPTEKALFRLFATVDGTVRTQEGAAIAYLTINDIESIQRRRQLRFPVNFYCTFIPMRDGEKAAQARGRPFGVGRVVDISIGGIKFETEYDLPIGLLGYFEARLPSGRMQFEGRIVNKKHYPTGPHAYGIKFGKMDAITSQRLNRLILQLERRLRQSQGGGTSAARQGARVAARRLAGDRRESGTARRRGRR